MEYKVTKDLELRERVRRVKEMLRLSMDGITAQRLRSLGYKLVFGVTYPRLKELAAKIQPDAELAMNLWKLHQRETMIIATIIMDPIEESTISYLIEDTFNEEIAEYLSRNLLTRASNPWSIVKSTSQGEYADYIRYSLASRLLLNGSDNEIVNDLIAESPAQTQKLNERQISSIASLLKRSYSTHPTEVESALSIIKSQEDAKSKWLAEELTTYIEFTK